MKLKGKVALVTGGGRGLGQGIVKRLAEAGCDVAAVDTIEENAKKVAEDVKAMDRRAIALKVDVTKWDQVQNMVKETIDKLGSLDIAVNNAGVISIMPVEELTEKDWGLPAFSECCSCGGTQFSRRCLPFGGCW